MNLWIRSQDKESITNITNVEYYSANGNHYIATYYDNLKVLGEYKSKERALEILDAIEERIINLELVSLEEKGKARKDAFQKKYLRCVYEMPKE